MSQKNDEKIMDFMEQNKGKEFRVSEIAEQTGIDIKNMSRYLKILEEQQKIKVRPIQEGRIRTKLISYAEPKKSEQLSPVPSSESPSSPSEPKTESEPQGSGPAAEPKNKEIELWAKIGELETRNAKLEAELAKTDEILESSKSQKQTSHPMEEFDDMIKYCFKNIQDADCQSFLYLNLPPRLMRALNKAQKEQLGIVEIRKGGGHSGATKLALTVLRKMRNQ